MDAFALSGLLATTLIITSLAVWNRRSAIALGGIASSLVLGSGWLAATTPFGFWVEGRFFMVPITGVLAYGAGCAAAFSLDGNRGPRNAALISAGLAVCLGNVALYRGVHLADKAVQYLRPEDREFVLQMSLEEGRAPFELAIVGAVLVVILLSTFHAHLGGRTTTSSST